MIVHEAEQQTDEDNDQTVELSYRAKRMRLVDHGQTVELSYYDLDTRIYRTRTFWVPSQGGYVRQTTWERPGTLGPQVCERLDTGGDTLYSETRQHSPSCNPG